MKRDDSQLNNVKKRTAANSNPLLLVERTCFLDKSAQRNNEKVFARLFQKAVVSKGEALVAVRRLRNLLTFKDQEGSQNNPVDCFGVGNPIKGFPEKFNFVKSDNSYILFPQSETAEMINISAVFY